MFAVVCHSYVKSTEYICMKCTGSGEVRKDTHTVMLCMGVRREARIVH
jgi:hypothetical protein